MLHLEFPDNMRKSSRILFNLLNILKQSTFHIPENDKKSNEVVIISYLLKGQEWKIRFIDVVNKCLTHVQCFNVHTLQKQSLV